MTFTPRIRWFGGLLLALAAFLAVMAIASPSMLSQTETASCHTLYYWRLNPEAWPVDSLTVGGQVYSRPELVALLNTQIREDLSLALLKQVVTAQLNSAVGCNSAEAEALVAQADALLAARPERLPLGIAQDSAEGAQIAALLPQVEALNTAANTADPEVSVIIEGPIQAINGSVITIFDTEIELDSREPALQVLAVGDVLRIEGAYVQDDDDDDDDDHDDDSTHTPQPNVTVVTATPSHTPTVAPNVTVVTATPSPTTITPTATDDDDDDDNTHTPQPNVTVVTATPSLTPAVTVVTNTPAATTTPNTTITPTATDDDDDDDDDDNTHTPQPNVTVVTATPQQTAQGGVIIIRPRVRVIAIIIIIVRGDFYVSIDGLVYRERFDCGSRPPAWAPAWGWRRRCEGTVIIIPSAGNPNIMSGPSSSGGGSGGGDGGGGDDHDDDDDDDDDDD